MSLMWSLGLCCFLVGASYAAEVCYNELGCFNTTPPWGNTDQRPVSALPWRPEEIGTRFLLFTPKNQYYQEITDQTIDASNYSGLRKTKFIIPGYLVNGDEDWPQDMCKAMVQQENVNCIVAEWKNGVKTRFTQAVSNARVVSAQVAFMMIYLMGHFRQTSDRFHIIGHGLGAHSAGDVGRRIPGIARITGLDPVEPYFQGTDVSVRLDTSDATFVDVIHTDGYPFSTKLGLGISEPVGHIDFYPNGGELMPGCSANRGDSTDLDSIWEGTSNFDPCNHARAYKYYTESISKSQGFVGYPCFDKDTFAAGKCFPCVDSTCPLMGHYADRFTVTDGISKAKYFLTTGSSKPFGRHIYKMALTLDGPSWPNLGILYVTLAGTRHSTKEFQLHIGTLVPGRMYAMQIEADVDVVEVTSVKFRWNNHIFSPLNPKYGASIVELHRGKDNKITHFCGTENVEENEIQSVLPCQS